MKQFGDNSQQTETTNVAASAAEARENVPRRPSGGVRAAPVFTAQRGRNHPCCPNYLCKCEACRHAQIPSWSFKYGRGGGTSRRLNGYFLLFSASTDELKKLQDNLETCSDRSSWSQCWCNVSICGTEPPINSRRNGICGAFTVPRWRARKSFGF